MSRCKKKTSSGLYGAMEDIRGRHTDHPAWCHSIWINQQPVSIIPSFLRRMPFLPQLKTGHVTPTMGGLHAKLILAMAHLWIDKFENFSFTHYKNMKKKIKRNRGDWRHADNLEHILVKKAKKIIDQKYFINLLLTDEQSHACTCGSFTIIIICGRVF